MAYQVFSRKWRPKKFQDVIGQEHVTKSLQNAILRNRLGHAYLLTGTRGIGKTSVARIFAKALRCTNRVEDANPCLECESCKDFDTGSSLNIIEIDGASNNSVDDIRDLINKVQTLPTTGKYKIYIIDEVHMLTTNAFNALLKTLEEPPEHVIFLLATTEPHKLLSTVLSRCQRFDFRTASVDLLVDHLVKICEYEGIKYQNKDLISVICEQGKGSFRDTLSLLDQVLSFSPDQTINDESIALSLGLAKTSSIVELLIELFRGDQFQVSSIYRNILFQNINLVNIANSILDSLYKIINYVDQPSKINWMNKDLEEQIEKMDFAELFWIYETINQDYIWITQSVNPEKAFEISLQKVSLRRELLGNIEVKKKSKKIEIPTEPVIEKITVPTEPVAQEPAIEEKKEQNEIHFEKNWSGFLHFLKENHGPLATNLEHGNELEEPTISDQKIEIKIAFKENAKVFYDYIMETDAFERLKSYIKNFFEFNDDPILNITMIKKEDNSFRSKVEIENDINEEINRKKEENLRNNPLILEAETIFNSKVDKVKINKK